MYVKVVSCSSVLLIYRTISSLSLYLREKEDTIVTIGHEGSEDQVRYDRQTH